MTRLPIISIVVANCLLVLAVVNAAIYRKQAIVDSGRTVFLELAPVDPRSLLQGDYMALSYALLRDETFIEELAPVATTRGRLLLKLDANSVGTFSRLDHDAAIEPESDEVPLKFRKWRRGWRFGIESFFFQEGHATVYESAGFAELRIAADGTAVLVDLRDKELNQLSTGGTK